MTKVYGVLICREDETRLDGWYYDRALADRMFQYQA